MRVSKFVLLLALAALCGCRQPTADNNSGPQPQDDAVAVTSGAVAGKTDEAITELEMAEFEPMSVSDMKSEAKKNAYAATPASSVASGPEGGVVHWRMPREMSAGAPGMQPAAEEAPLAAIVNNPVPVPGQGEGPGMSGDKFAHVEVNPFRAVADEPLSTFSIDVDTASYSKIRSYLVDYNQLPPQGAVRVEELINYFTYNYQAPTDQHPFAANTEVAACPWNPDHRLVRIGIKGKEIDNANRPASNLVFLLDVSGSMDDPRKLPLLKQGMKLLVDQLGENDKVAIVVYAGAAGMVLNSTNGDDKSTIMEALDRLQAGGSTNGGQGIALAYQTAMENFIKGGVNRVILCTDGDFNVGVTSTSDLVTMAAEKAKSGVFLSVMGFGIGNHNDSMMEELSGKANGNYAFIDTMQEAKKVLVEQMSGTLTTIAKDVKIQIEFNPNKVSAYRLVGYENRVLANEDFNDDKKDAGEIGAGHCVTAFYEIVPASVESPVSTAKVDDLKYQSTREKTEAADSDELLTLKIRYKQPDEDESTLMSVAVKDSGHRFGEATGDFQFATGVAMFGMLLRGDEQDAKVNLDEITELVSNNVGDDSYRGEFLKLVQATKTLKK
ncbi:VWA domain-containing protein [Blastopirellula sp. JC732]|uniref:VWA domain-containing protein n=1 Tax=Blastopirellula sediminis TaxID=2894196 RepID=A0A9X1SH01_9BACT|nr:VWA domain-containing protein [Blastopirellula sediminis]MCC9607160.1 VWA domain-containing protein [Blastopirellula sediminis]MCC9629547.1 VWA domain-containing protein [Blastopirellula sediminis]